ncbi:type IV pilus modification protein PilV [Acinetobacter sp. CWB-B33]|jgi:type IV pilus assembly protein PilV|uniref:type IV pilus modification protein PilV n=1 Tax=Acinetobacter sp. CWB-B33 TaxID=2815724 RepID=UPI0031FE59AB
MNMNKQQGVGLVEVLVALLLLSIAILGFASLQLRAVQATSEGANRIQAMNLARDLAEKIRMNNGTDALAAYQQNMGSQSAQETEGTNCYNNFCLPAAKAAFDVHESYLQAQKLGMVMNMIECPGTANGRSCIYVAWNKTDATDNTTDKTGQIACTSSQQSSFTYQDNSTCIVMEAF